MSNAIYWLNVADNHMIAHYEARYSCEAREMELRHELRPSLQIQTSGLAGRHWSDCCREWSRLTYGRNYARHYSGIYFKSISSQLDDFQHEGKASLEALAIEGLPVFTKEKWG